MEAILALIIFCVGAYYLKEFLDGIERKQAIAKEKKREQRVLEEARRDKEIVFVPERTKAREAINAAGGLNESAQANNNKLERLFNNFKKLSTKNLEQFSKEIEQQFNFANNRLERAQLLINDELGKINSFQTELLDTKIIEYENAIQPFRQSLYTFDNRKSVSVSAISDYTLPIELAPDNLKENLDMQFSSLNKSLAKLSTTYSEKFRSNKNKLSKEDAMVIAIQAAITSGLFYLGRAEKYKNLQKMGEDVCKYCLDKEGTISNYGRIQSIIQQKYRLIERKIKSVNRLLPEVRTIRDRGQSFQQLSTQEIKFINDLHHHGEELKKYLITDIFR